MIALAVADRFTARSAAAIYCLVTALAFLLWWILLLAVPASRSWFFPSSMTGLPLSAFAVADALTAVALVFCGTGLLRKRPVRSLLLCATGGLLYATLYCIVLSWKTGEAWIGSAAMSVCTGLLLAFCTIVTEGEPSGFRESRSDALLSPFTRTLLQIVVFWSICLWIVPLGIQEFEQRIDWPFFRLPGGALPGWIVFFSASALGLASAWAMVSRGGGTPLPSDCAPTLVQAGVYRVVRNPMALAGIVQGIASGLILGSYSVVLISILGGAFWHFGIRPVEERDMLQRFGAPYADYRSRVGLWLPKRNLGEVSG
ncbi:MAG: isoprenylcysteine carboxylmethyltransferase family protein [Planctomycetota bacterium]